MKRRISKTSATVTLKRQYAVTQAILRYPPPETVKGALILHWLANTKPVSLGSMIKSYFTTGIALRLALRASVSQTLADPRSYAKGQTTTEIVESIKDIYEVDISTSLVSRVTDNILDDITAWQNRPLSSLYPIVYLDCIVVKVRQDKQIINKAIYLALGVNLEGKKELLGMWVSENEGAKFWLGVLTELQNRGVQDILIACVDGLKGFSEAINTVYPNTQVQLCIVHMVRYSMKFVPWKDRRKVAADLKAVYGADTLELAEANLEQFDDTWGDKYPHVIKSWRNNWEGLTVFFGYPKDIRKAIYTTNAIESLNSVIRTAVNKRKIFPSDKAAFKVVYLATQQASKKWSMPIRNWTSALNRFMIMFDERVSKHLI